MAVTFSLPTVLARLADGQATIKSTGATLGDVVADIAGRFPRLAPRLRDETGGPYPFVTYYLNDEDIRFRNGFATFERGALSRQRIERTRRAARRHFQHVRVDHRGAHILVTQQLLDGANVMASREQVSRE